MFKDYEVRKILDSSIGNKVISKMKKKGRKYNLEVKGLWMGVTGPGKTLGIVLKGDASNEK